MSPAERERQAYERGKAEWRQPVVALCLCALPFILIHIFGV